jgi:hypothetical protein
MDDIKGYEGLYQINRQGEIWSISQRKFMKPQKTEDGYLWVKLQKDKICHKGRIHRLLAIQYIDNPDNLPECDHIDRNKMNNSIENLRWVSKQDNMKNKPTYHENMTEDQLEKRKQHNKEVKALWAKNKNMNMTEEQRQEKNRKQQEYRAKKKLNN